MAEPVPDVVANLSASEAARIQSIKAEPDPVRRLDRAVAMFADLAADSTPEGTPQAVRALVKQRLLDNPEFRALIASRVNRNR